MTSLTSAINDEDLLGVSAVISPDELPELQKAIEAVQALGDRSGLTSSGGKAGFDISVNVTVDRVEELSQDAARVDLSGSVGVAGPRSVTDLVARLLGSRTFDGTADLDQLPGWLGVNRYDQSVPTFVITVRHGGRWFVSPMLTMADYVRDYFDLSDGDWDQVAPPKNKTRSQVFKSGERSLENLFDAVADFDAGQLSLSLPESQARVLRVFADPIDDLIDDIRQNSGQISFSNVDAKPIDGYFGAPSVLLSGVDVAVSWLDEYEGYVSRQGSLDGTCVEAPDLDDGGLQRSCLPDDLFRILGITKKVPIETVTEDGSVKIDFVRSVLSLLIKSAASVDKVDVLYATGAAWADVATPMTLGTPMKGTVSFDTPYVVYEFDGQAGQTFDVELDGSDVFVSVHGPDGGYYEDVYDDSTDTATVEVSGPQRILVEAYDRDRSESFTLTVTVNTSGGGSSSTTLPREGSDAIPAGATVVRAGPGLVLDQPSYAATSVNGVVTIAYVQDDTQRHTLVVTEANGTVVGRKLEVVQTGSVDVGLFQLAPGTYTVHCDVPGHVAAQATLVVT